MQRRAFTLIELLVVIAIIAILASILFPVFVKVREKARITECESNLKQFALGILEYAQDSDEDMPIAIKENHEAGPLMTTLFGVPQQGLQVGRILLVGSGVGAGGGGREQDQAGNRNEAQGHGFEQTCLIQSTTNQGATGLRGAGRTGETVARG